MTKEESLKKVGEKLEGMRSCMLVTMTDDGLHVGRPMATQDIEFDGTIWFMTDRRSNKCRQITAYPQVELSYAHSNGVRFVSLSGEASLVEDRARIKEFWNPFYQAWFENEDDPNIVLIKVDIARAAYWDNQGGKLGALADMAIGAVTGKTNTLDDHGVVTFS